MQRAQQCWEEDQKYQTKTTVRPRTRLVWGRSCHKTTVSDHKTDIRPNFGLYNWLRGMHCRRRHWKLARVAAFFVTD